MCSFRWPCFEHQARAINPARTITRACLTPICAASSWSCPTWSLSSHPNLSAPAVEGWRTTSAIRLVLTRCRQGLPDLLQHVGPGAVHAVRCRQSVCPITRCDIYQQISARPACLHTVYVLSKSAKPKHAKHASAAGHSLLAWLQLPPSTALVLTHPV